MDFQLTEQQRRMVAVVRELAQGEFKANAPKYMDGTFPWDNMKKLADIGVLGMSVPGRVWRPWPAGVRHGAGARGDRKNLLRDRDGHPRRGRCADPRHRGLRASAIRAKILPKVVSGDCILAVCMTEPHAGTDVANYRTNAVIKGDRVILNGTKTLISRAREAGMFVIFTRIDGKPGREGIGCVLLEPDTPGFEVTGTYHTMGGENLHEIQFNDCELPLENLVIRDDGFRKLLNAFNTQRCLNPSISLGLAEGAFEEARNYVRDRTVFGKPIGDYQGVRWKLAEMYREIETARSMLYRACITANPFPDPLMAAVAKITCNEMSNRVTSEAIQLHGGFGFTDEFAVSRLYRGARYGTLGGGTSETPRDLIGKRIMDAAETGAELLAYDMLNGA